MAVTCKNCELAPVVCQISLNGLELIYCQDCVDAVVLANHRVHETHPLLPEPGDPEFLNATEKRLQELIDSGDWKKPKEKE